MDMSLKQEDTHSFPTVERMGKERREGQCGPENASDIFTKRIRVWVSDIILVRT